MSHSQNQPDNLDLCFKTQEQIEGIHSFTEQQQWNVFSPISHNAQPGLQTLVLILNIQNWLHCFNKSHIGENTRRASPKAADSMFPHCRNNHQMKHVYHRTVPLFSACIITKALYYFSREALLSWDPFYANAVPLMYRKRKAKPDCRSVGGFNVPPLVGNNGA